MAPDVVIVGAGPAGMRAAEVLAGAGLRPIVIDEAPASGGQIYRRPPPGLARAYGKLYGFEARHARRLHEAFDALKVRVDYWPNSAIWNIRGNRLDVITPSGARNLTWDRLILATGAMDRVIPFPGWTLPGVFTLGGAQTALKSQACAVGERPVFLGTGPLLYLTAFQYAAAGVLVQAVLDTACTSGKRRALPGLVSGGQTFLKGLYYLGWLRAHGIRLVSGVTPVKAESGPDGALLALTWRDRRGREQRTLCDALAFGFGLKSETQLADLCGAPFSFHSGQRQWLPVQDAEGRAGVEGVYIAGDGGGINGAAAAELSGTRAAHAVLHDLGLRDSSAQLATLTRKLSRFDRFRKALDEQAFPFPAELASSATDDLMICRCEGVTAGELRQAAGALGAREINRVKALTRLGMGRCQGRICSAGATEILARALAVPPVEIGRLRGQAPVKPLPLAHLIGEVAA
jgi:hydrogen cyanide synthase HcnB